MKIQIDPHTLERTEERGTNEDEIKDVINTGFSIPGKYGRKGKAKVYDFQVIITPTLTLPHQGGRNWGTPQTFPSPRGRGLGGGG